MEENNEMSILLDTLENIWNENKMIIHFLKNLLDIFEDEKNEPQQSLIILKENWNNFSEEQKNSIKKFFNSSIKDIREKHFVECYVKWKNQRIF